MQLVLPLRRSVFYVSLTGFLAGLGIIYWSPVGYWLAAVFGPLTLLGLYHILQRRRTLSRNYPILIQFRYFLESIGPELRQYLFESDHDERPFSREQRHLVYRRSKRTLDKKPFGTMINVYENNYEWVNHSISPARVEEHDFRITVGDRTQKPYSVSLFNISALSFGAVSPNAIRALNGGAARGGFYQDTGEGGISQYHLENGGDLVWQIGSGYFGCRTADGRFDPEQFARTAALEQVRMIEIKLSQGAKPGHGGVLPGRKVNAEIAAARGVEPGRDVISPASHSTFSTPLELMDFIRQLRELSGGKPVGLKLAIGHPWEWFAIVKAMMETGERPDFIVVDGGEGGTGAAPVEFSNRLGSPLRDALLLVHNTLVGTDLRKEIRIAAAGKITSAFMIARLIPLGADWCNAARGFMFSLGCIQALSCHTDRCPSGVATQDPHRWRHLDVSDKTTRVYNFHRSTLQALAEMTAAAGLSHPAEFAPCHLLRRVSEQEVLSYEELYPFLEPGELLHGIPDQRVYRQYWQRARPDSFQLPKEMA